MAWIVAAALFVGGCGGGAEAAPPGGEPVEDGAVVATATPSAADGAPPSAATEGAGLLVDVAGHVRQPGVYRLAPGARVHEAIAAAGGPRAGAQLAALNRAATLVDGQQVLVSGPSPGPPDAPGSAAAAPAPTAQVSLNNADAAALDALPGIGPVTAEKIVADRAASGPFSSVDDLDRVPGIGPATIESLRDVVTA